MIKIMNLRNSKPSTPYCLRVDRSNKVLGNHFEMKNQSDAERNRVCDEYDAWIRKELNAKNKEVRDNMNAAYLIYKQYGKLNLYCWCAPKRCHAETIRDLILNASK